MNVLHLMSCRGWSSDAYWAARISRELARRGHRVVLGCRAGTDARVISRVRDEGVTNVETFAFASGLAPLADVADVHRLRDHVRAADVVHVHRGKEHWLAAAALCAARVTRPVIRTRHIAQAVRPHAGNAWLYRRATSLVVTVTEAIRGQYVAAALLPPERVIALPGGADVERYRPGPPDSDIRARLGGVPGEPLVGMIGGFRVMKGHRVVIEAAARLAARGVRPRFVFVGQGTSEPAVRAAIAGAALGEQFTIAGFAADLPEVMRALDVALYVPLESDGMSRVLFEYLAAGVPVVASRVGVVPEVLTDGAQALLVPGADAPALAEALARALGDGELRRRLGEAGRRLVVDRYSGARVAEALEERYGRLLARRGPPA